MSWHHVHQKSLVFDPPQASRIWAVSRRRITVFRTSSLVWKQQFNSPALS